MPVIHLPFRGRANLRNHRKIVVVDNRRAIIGGMNLAGEYMGPTPIPRRWRDLSLVIAGPAVADLADAVPLGLEVRDRRGPRAGPGAPRPPRPGGFDDCPAQVVASGPDVAGDPLYETLLSVLFAANASGSGW